MWGGERDKMCPDWEDQNRTNPLDCVYSPNYRDHVICEFNSDYTFTPCTGSVTSHGD